MPVTPARPFDQRIRIAALRLAALILGPLLILAAAGLVSAPASAASLSYSAFYAFGDSLTDNGNAYRLSLGFVPRSPPYHRGRFSDGRNWYDRVAKPFRAEELETRNFAFGGAHAATNLDGIPDLNLQRRAFRDRVGRPAPGALAAVWGGGNDLLAGIGNDRLKRTAYNAADAVIATAASLGRNGVDAALIFNLPSFADLPRYANSSREKRKDARRGVRMFNERLGLGVEALRADGLEVIEVDVFALYKDVVANPGDYGIDNLTRPCLKGNRNRCSEEEAKRSAFFDTIHPSARLHRILGAHVLDLLAPPPVFAGLLDDAAPFRAAAPAGPVRAAAVAAAPLPAPALLLLAALAGLGLVGRARRRAA